MTIGVAARATHLPFNGPDDPSLPSGIWNADIEVTGDASGGIMAVDVILANSGELIDSFFSLEQVGLQLDQDAGVNNSFFVANQDNLRSPGTPISSTFAQQMFTGAGDGRSGPRGGADYLPYFIGKPPAAVAGAQMFLRWQATNTDLVAWRGHVWGYVWGPRAISTPTGPRRPFSSPFGT